MANITQIIKYEGDNTTLIWKHPCEDFNSLSQLIVHESQEAIFLMNGQILDTFGAGKYTLESQNIPKISAAINKMSDDKTPFHCEVFFINKVEQLLLKWGTSDKVQYIDPQFGFPLSIGASGEMGISVDNGKKLLLKLVGTQAAFNQQNFIEYFRALLNTRIKTYIAQYMKNNCVSIFEIDENLFNFSESLKDLLTPSLLEYGISLDRFFVTDVVKPEGDKQYEQFKDLYFRKYSEVQEAELRQKTAIINANTDAQKTIIDSQAMATKRIQEGFTYQQEKGFEVASEVAKNEAVGQLTNMGIGLGSMAGVGASFGSLVGNSVSNAFNKIGNTTRICESCHASIPSEYEYCPLCGKKRG